MFEPLPSGDDRHVQQARLGAVAGLGLGNPQWGYCMDKGSASFNVVNFVVLFDHSVTQGELSASFSKNACADHVWYVLRAQTLFKTCG